MTEADWWGIAWLFVLLAANAFFVGAEFAVVAAKRSQVEPRAEAGSRAAKTALWAMEHATLMLATCQLGITICSLLILNVSEPAIKHLLGRFEPSELEARMSKPGGLGNLFSGSRQAQNWQQFTALYKQISSEAQDDFQDLFGREFSRAYEEHTHRLRRS